VTREHFSRSATAGGDYTAGGGGYTKVHSAKKKNDAFAACHFV
jgi:hypothetical protein